MGLREIIGSAHGGTSMEWGSLGRYLKDNYIDNGAEKTRRSAASKRDAYYEGNGNEYIVSFIEVAFKDIKNRRLRADLVDQAKWNNVLKRVSHETATVYAEPAKRRISGDAANYEEFVELAGLDAAMREADRKLVYHDDVWIQYRVRKESKEPVLDVVSPAGFWAVCDPMDRTRLVAIILDETPSPGASKYHAHYRVVTDSEIFMMDGECRVIVSTLAPHGHGRLPGVLVSTRPASSKARLLSISPAADLVAAHETVWFLNVLLIKESKSATKQTVFTGDTSAATVGQSSDTESDIVMPEGTNTQTLDRGMDLAQFRDNADHILERAAANHGLPPSVLHHRDSSSGAEIHLRRIPLRELRRQRIPIMRTAERRLAEIQSEVNATELPEYAFSTDGWGINYGEVQQPLTESEADAVFEKRRQLGLTTTQDELMRRDPDLRTHEAALAQLEVNITRETNRVVKMKALMAVSGGMGSEMPRAAPGNDESGDEDQDTTLPKRK